ncbi:MAG: response regulator [Nitrospirales bacterium]
MTLNADRMPILVIDDSSEDYQTLQRCFNKLGFDNPLVHCAEGEKALSLLESTSGPKVPATPTLKPGCIFLDLNIPDMDGRTILRSIKTHPQLKQTPVLVLSSSDDPNDITASYRDGANFYMVKPSNFEALVKSMRAFRNFWLETVEHPL